MTLLIAKITAISQVVKCANNSVTNLIMTVSKLLKFLLQDLDLGLSISHDGLELVDDIAVLLRLLGQLLSHFLLLLLCTGFLAVSLGQKLFQLGLLFLERQRNVSKRLVVSGEIERCLKEVSCFWRDKEMSQRG